MSTVAIDCRFAGFRDAGIGRYTRELVDELVRLDAGQEWILFVQSQEEAWLSDLPSTVHIVETPIPHYSWQEQWAFRKIIKTSGAQLLFSPHFNVPFFCPIPYVITVHDLILHWYPNQASFIKRLAYKLLLSRSVRKARAIITVSNFTAGQLQYVYGKRAFKKTTVILEGVSDLFQPQSQEKQKEICNKFGLKKPYFLYVGNAKQHKNVQMLLDAFEALGDKEKELVFVSGGPEVQQLRIPEGVIMVRNVSDAELPALYSAAIAFVTASLYEGFGLPVAEAQACGCPVIATNCTALPEVADTSARLIEPTIEQLKTALAHPPTRSTTPSSKTFSWRTSAQKTLEVLMRAQEA